LLFELRYSRAFFFGRIAKLTPHVGEALGKRYVFEATDLAGLAGAERCSRNAAGFDLIGGTPEDLSNLIRRETETWAPVIKKVGLKVD